MCTTRLEVRLLSRRKERSVEIGISLFIALSAGSGVFGRVNGQATLGGRLNLFYQESNLGEVYDRNFNQDLTLTVYDDLFAKNRIALSYLMVRKTDSSSPRAYLRQRIRSTITGTAFVASTEYSPPYTLRGRAGAAAEKAKGQRYLLALEPEDLPSVSMSYERTDKYGGSGDSRTDMKTESKLATVSYGYRFSSVRATYRERSSSDRVAPELSRRLREGTGGVTLEKSLGRIGSVMGSYDGFISREDLPKDLRATVRIDNFRGLVSSHPVNWLSFAANFLSTAINRENEDVVNTKTQEVYSSISVIPRDYLLFQFARDIRETAEDGDETLTDYARAQATIQGRVRSHIRGRASVQRTFVLRSQRGAFPSNGYFFNLDTDFLPGTQLVFDVNITQTENPQSKTGRFQIRKIVDLRGYPRPNLALNVAINTFEFGDKLSLLGAKTYDVEMNLNYRPKPRFSAILTATRSIDRRVEGGSGFFLSSTLTYTLLGGSHMSLIYIRRDVSGTIFADTGTEARATYPNNYILELVLQLAGRSRLSLKYDIRDLARGGVSTVFGVTFIKRF
ncbi:MAG: hypothetical protein ACE5OP_08245 [Candidatus Glassbacteria bacterium]